MPIGQSILIPLTALSFDPRQNYRRGDDPKLDELAQSMRDLGLIQPIVVCQAGAGFDVVAGFRRVAAAHLLHWESISATVASRERADLIRLAENFDRENPTTYETSRYLYELSKGVHGRRRTSGELAEAVGLSASHVRNLIRVYRDAPSEVREAWEADRDHRFTFAHLNALVLQAKRGENVSGALAKILRPEPELEAEAAAPVVQGPQRRGEKGERGAKAPKATAGRRLGPSGAERMAKALAVAGEERLRTDDRAVLLLEVLGAVAGRVPATHVQARVDEVLRDLGVAPAAKAGAA